MSNSRLVDVTIIVVFFAGLLAPAAAFLIGMRAHEFEERPLAPAPDFSRMRLFDPSFYEATTDYLTDRNPLRKAAVVASARLTQRVTGDVATQSVIGGSDGWLFLRNAIATPCIDADEIGVQMRNLAQVGRALRAAGKDYLVAIAPDKNAVYFDLLSPPAKRLGACAERNRAVYRSSLAVSNISFIDAWALFDDLRATAPVYPREDTHWNEFGSAAFVAAVVAKFDPELIHGGPEFEGDQVSTPDLSRMAGLHRRSASPVVRLRRGGLHDRSPQQINHGGEGRPFVLNRSISTVPLSTKRLLVIHDSYMYVAWDQLAQFYSDAFYVHFSALTPELFGALAREADMVLIETAERETDERLAAFFSDNRMAASLNSDIDPELQAAVSEWWPQAGPN